MDAKLAFLVEVVVLEGFYGVVGLLFFIRRNRKQISSRSPLLVLISQFGNSCEQFCLLMNVHSMFLSPNSIQMHELFIFFHFVYYLPYSLRAYRLYFVFSSGQDEEKQAERYFLKHIQRSKQTWLIRVLGVLMIPVVIFCIVLLLVRQVNAEFSSRREITPVLEAILIGLSFVEEMVLLTMVYLLRRVDKEFAMNRELLLTTLLWYLNVVFAFHTQYSFWMTELLIRNTIIMCISMLWPLLQSYKKPDIKEMLTLEALHELPIVLQEEIPFDFFESFLSQLQTSEHADSIARSALAILRLYLNVSIFKDSPSSSEAEKFISEFEQLNRQAEVMPARQVMDLRRTVESKELTPSLLAPFESVLYGLLNENFFPLFLKSPTFRKLCKRVEEMELRTSTVTNTSLYGKSR